MNSETPRTDAVKFVVDIFEDGYHKRYQTVSTVEHAEQLERENQQLRDGLKGCAAVLNAHDAVQLSITIPQWETLRIKALSHPAIQALKDQPK